MFKKNVLILAVFLFFGLAKGWAFEGSEWDFGEVKHGKLASHIFEFKNNSNSIERVESVFSSCPCTAAKVDKKELQPGETGKLEVIFNSHGYSGEVSQYVYLNSNSKKNPVAKFILRFKVVR